MRRLLHKHNKAPNTARSRVGRLSRLALIVPFVILLLTVVLVLPWRWVSPPTTTFMVRERVFGADPVHFRWVGWEEISPNLPIAAVAAEDQKFPDHHGFDWEAVRDALGSNSQGGQIRGGSTISQQLVKNLFLWPGQNWFRKGVEAYLTFWIELLWPKQRLLEVYLNVAEFGPGVFGVGEASERLLGKSPAELTPHDAAVLVAVLPSPKRMSAATPSEYVRRRANQIQAEVGALGGPSYLSGLEPFSGLDIR